MTELDVLWDFLSAGVNEYVYNYFLARIRDGRNSVFRLEPSYEVDYELNNTDELFREVSLEESWMWKVAECRNINDLPPYLQELIVQYLPRFFERFPEFKDDESLKLR